MRVPLTLIDFLERGALHGDRIALVDEPAGPASLGRVGHADVARRARGMAGELDRLGVPHGARVAIVSPNSARFVISLYGVSAYGRVLVPVNFRLNADEVDYVVRHSGAEVVLIDPELDEALAGVTATHRILLDGDQDAALFAPTDEEPEPWEPDEDATASINYTSGTTARPKGVQLTHRTLWLHATSFGWHLAVGPREVYLQCLPLFHCNGWGVPYALTAMGARLVVVRKVDGAEILRRVDQHGGTLTCGAPAVADAILAAAEGMETVPGHGRMRVMLGGAASPTSTIRRIQEGLGWEYMHGYGLTESSPVLTFNRARPEDDGLPPEERAARLARQGMQVVGVRVRVDAQGELLARSNHVLEAYWDDPDATDQALDGGWLRTGDGAVIDDEHHVTITDRKKDVINSGAENVSSLEVEDHLRGHPAIADAAVIGVPDERFGEAVKAIVTLREGAEASEEELIAFCRERMAGFKRPRSIEIRDALPRTATGKIQKYLLRRPYWEGPAGS